MIIYALIDPRSNLVRYIGKTSNRKKRFGFHVRNYDVTPKGKWIQELKALGLQPVLRVIETINSNDRQWWRVIEDKWITLYREKGFPILNQPMTMRKLDYR